MASDLKGQFASVVHTVSAVDSELSGMFTSVVHTAASSDAELEGQFVSLVHTVAAVNAELEGQFLSLVHSVPAPAAIVPNITGTVGVIATFDGSASTGVQYYHWSWVAVPGGSAIANAPIPFPDAGAVTPIDMTNNVGLWHFNVINTVTTPTGSVGLIDTFGDGWHGNNFVNVSVNGVAVLTNITLPAGTGPLWFDYPANLGDTVAVGYTPGSFPTECKYDLNDAAGGTGTTFYNSPTNPTVTYTFAAPAFTPASSFTTPDTSGSGNTGQVNGATLVAGKVGSFAMDFTAGDYIEVPNAASLNSATGTIALWIKTSTSTAGTTASLISKNTNVASREGFHLYLANNLISAQIKNAGGGVTTLGAAGPALNDGLWHQIIFIYNSGGTSELYVDGSFVDSQPTVVFTVTTSFPLRMAVNVDGFWGNYVGAMDEVAMWSRVLSLTEITNIYAAQNGTLAGIGSSTFSFVPDVVGTYTINLAIDASTNTNADAVISNLPPSGGGVQGIGRGCCPESYLERR
jgi:hypothetical protein